ncbi:EP300-interacting inhibitor of differentiation 3 [Nymphalis io]|uniref:EP300-interacting inhibitor of differentiation 3 n=1 Tax=Inachis io TaxID=171585 RepID=UPI002167A39D|nr:EP300-interacting inhibitor of differentiation 3 [Nymphalis io]XP_050359724.1 EP300-interacting inhibitor of differentiation 3 [Nymphalis io]XP_050359725.1 EP300-interacting inhibitor of differentiation 3 [Nymphalis io]
MASQRPSASSQDDTQRSRHSYESRDRYILMKNLLSDTNNIENKTINPMEMIEMTKEIVREANMLFSNGSLEERAQHPSENFLDSQLMRASSDVIVRCSQAISTNLNKYDKHELADHIKRFDDFWNFAFPLEAPPVAYLYGTFAPTPLPPRTRARRAHTQRQQAAPPKVPKKPDIVATQEEETPDFAEKMYRSLKKICKDGPVSYFHVVLDPTSFSHTVENIYHLSFLARDGRLSVYLDEAAGVPLVNTVSHHKRRRSENSSEKQFIVSLDKERWRDLVEAFNVMEPLLKFE